MTQISSKYDSTSIKNYREMQWSLKRTEKMLWWPWKHLSDHVPFKMKIFLCEHKPYTEKVMRKLNNFFQCPNPTIRVESWLNKLRNNMAQKLKNNHRKFSKRDRKKIYVKFKIQDLKFALLVSKYQGFCWCISAFYCICLSKKRRCAWTAPWKWTF